MKTKNVKNTKAVNTKDTTVDNVNVKEEKKMTKMTLKEMREIAKAKKIKGYNQMTKSQLQQLFDDIAQIEAENTAEFLENGKEQPASKDLVEVKAFTGMVIGLFKVVKETKTKLGVVTAKGDKLIFDKKTGLQTNANNPRFANRIAL